MNSDGSRRFRVEWRGPDGEDWDYDEDPGPLFHVSDARNRESIRQHGLDWRRMGAHAGIAGSRGAELAGVFIAREHEVDWLAGFARRRGLPAVDVWAVELEDEQLVHDDGGHLYSRQPIPPERLMLDRTITLPGVPSDW